jgi:hypothetical protein
VSTAINDTQVSRRIIFTKLKTSQSAAQTRKRCGKQTRTRIGEMSDFTVPGSLPSEAAYMARWLPLVVLLLSRLLCPSGRR